MSRYIKRKYINGVLVLVEIIEGGLAILEQKNRYLMSQKKVYSEIREEQHILREKPKDKYYVRFSMESLLNKNPYKKEQILQAGSLKTLIDSLVIDLTKDGVEMYEIAEVLQQIRAEI